MSNQVLTSAAQLGILLQTGRRSKQYSQTDLAHRIGLSQPRLSSLEGDPSGMTVAQLLTVCTQLNLELTLHVKTPAGDLSAVTKGDEGNSEAPPKW